MKKFAIFALCLIMVFSTVIASYAELDVGTALAIELLKYYRYETEQITLAVKDNYTEWEKYLGKDVDYIDFPLMYQVYYLKMKDIVSAYDEEGTFGANITDKYYWVVPNYEKGSEVQVVRNEQTEYGWDIRRGTTFMKSIRFSYPDVGFGIAMMYENALNAYPDADKDSFKLIYDEENDMHVMYFTCEEQEYVVPYFSSKEIGWVTNETVYPASEFIELMRSNVTEGSGVSDIPSGNGDPKTIYFSYVLIGSGLVVCVAVAAIIIARKRQKRQAK